MAELMVLLGLGLLIYGVTRPKGKKLWWVIGGLVVMGLGGSLLPPSSSPESAPAPVTAPTQTAPTPATNPSQATPATSQPAKEEPKPDLELIEAKGQSDGFALYIVGKARNNTNRELSYAQIEFNIYDKEGNLLGSAMDNVTNWEPGTVWSFKAVFLGDAEKAHSFKFKDLSGY
ncbi:FxLYD domain-containing protein [Thermus scotoductus]|uniref:DUF3426 domain-containing protein n=1 Tax=Thermus scotoductus TaxID=37636 RepID=A0A430RZJ0_THESC|nr:FxLYD domain-containing protein [Thermus scotoductus]RTH26588.1 hypothetical protein CSW40_04630 [Thermus scotoductus]RTI40701.1 hypothetical protein CSW18_04640 [Thermus scotoductus]